MTFDEICETCRALPAATEDVKWENNLVFSVGAKMFAVLSLDGEGAWPDLGFKCAPERFEALLERKGLTPAKYLARAQWVTVGEDHDLTDGELKELLAEAHQTVFAKLPKRLQRELAEG
jgi:predicted DNA-binding protein (MmcQ/YjbR family)